VPALRDRYWGNAQLFSLCHHTSEMADLEAGGERERLFDQARRAWARTTRLCCLTASNCG
jgi:hypothetical protein